jgi:hypothetical protein
MSWYQDATNPTQRWRRRAPIAVDNTGGSVGNIDITCVVPKDWDDFWNNVNQVDGRDIRVTDSDGKTLLVFDLNGFDVSTRTLTLEVDNYAAPAAAMLQLWVYWGNASANTAAASFVASAPKTGTIWLAAPGFPAITVTEERPRDTKPANKLAKQASTQTWVWWNLDAVLLKREFANAQDRLLEEIAYVSYVINLNGTPQSMTDVTLTRYIDGWVAVFVKAGTTGSNYTVALTVTTSEGRTLVFSAELNVRTVSEA